MKFQDSSFNGLKVTVGTKMCDPRTHTCSKSIMPHQHFQSWGHKNTRSKPEDHWSCKRSPDILT